jgi:hypothetical protein
MPDLNNPRMVEARKKLVLGRLKDPNYQYHNTTDYGKKRKAEWKESDDTRKRMS